MTSSGRKISHGEAFDTVGGVYLNARENPYHYGGSEIDAAVNHSFDSIAVAPGMTVEIRSETDALIYQGQGPYMALSSDHSESVTHVGSILRTREAQMPAWMRDYLHGIGYNFARIPLHGARFVRVTRTPGVACQQ